MTHFILIVTAEKCVLCSCIQQMLKLVFHDMLQAVVNVMCSNRLRGYKKAFNVHENKFNVEQLSIHTKSNNTISYKQPNTSILHLFSEEQNFIIIWILTSHIGICISMVTFKLIKMQIINDSIMTKSTYSKKNTVCTAPHNTWHYWDFCIAY